MKVTEEVKKVMADIEHFKYLLVGGGVAAGAAAKGIREKDPAGSIGIVSADVDEPYARPALSKKLWVDHSFTLDDTILGTGELPHVTVHLQQEVTKLVRDKHEVVTKQGQKYSYDKLLLATGNTPNKLPGPDSDLAIALRSKDDYRKITAFSQPGKHVLVVGSSFTASEIAAGLAQNDVEVTLVVDTSRLFENAFPEELSSQYQQKYEEQGIKILTGVLADKYEVSDGEVKLTLKNGDVLSGDGLVMGIGSKPNVDFAEKAGLKMAAHGIVTNNQFVTSDPNIWAVGDIATYPDKIMGLQRIEHVRHAEVGGQLAGENMAGANKPYTWTPYFYSWVYDINWEGVGVLDASQTMYRETLAESGGETVYYFDKSNRLDGVLVWNYDHDLDHFRNILREKPTIDELTKVIDVTEISEN